MDSFYAFVHKVPHDQAENSTYLLGEIISGSHKIVVNISIPFLSGL